MSGNLPVPSVEQVIGVMTDDSGNPIIDPATGGFILTNGPDVVLSAIYALTIEMRSRFASLQPPATATVKLHVRDIVT